MKTTRSVRLWMLCILFFPLFLGALLAKSVQADEVPKPVLRIMCYNIRHCRGMDDIVNLERTGNAIKKWKPDLVALQEVDKNTQRTNKTDQTKLLAEQLEMHFVFGKAIPYQGGEYGLAILSRFPILEHQMILLPPEVQQEQRGVLIAKIGIPDAQGKVIRFASTHLSVASHEERAVQIEKIDTLLSEGSEPVIVAGDFNTRPENESVVRFLKNWKDVADPAWGKNVTPLSPRRIDFIFLRSKDSWEVLESRTIDDRITSDHMPIFSVITL